MPTPNLIDGLNTGEIMNPGYTDADGDVIDGADGVTDTILGNGGDDSIDGGIGDDAIYGDVGWTNAGRESFNWEGVTDGQIDSSVTQNTGSVAVTYTRLDTTGTQSAQPGTATIDTSGIVADGAAVDNNSSLSSVIGGSGSSEFGWSFDAPVTNVSFNITDLDARSEVTVRAFDTAGNEINVDLTAGSEVSLRDTDGQFGADTGRSAEVGSNDPVDPDATMTVSIPGPVARFDVFHTTFVDSESGVNISDIYFDGPNADAAVGNDSLSGGAGDDQIFGEDGDDTIDGGTGEDTLFGDNTGGLVSGADGTAQLSVTINSQAGQENGSLLAEITDVDGAVDVVTLTDNYDADVGTTFTLDLDAGDSVRLGITSGLLNGPAWSTSGNARIDDIADNDAIISFEDGGATDFQDVVVTAEVTGPASVQLPGTFIGTSRTVTQDAFGDDSLIGGAEDDVIYGDNGVADGTPGVDFGGTENVNVAINSQAGANNGSVLAEVTSADGSVRVETLTTSYDGNVGNDFDLGLEAGDSLRVGITVGGRTIWSDEDGAVRATQTETDAVRLAFEDEGGSDFDDVILTVDLDGITQLELPGGQMLGNVGNVAQFLGDGDGGADVLIGGEGADTLFGEGGDDTFIVTSAADGAGDVVVGGNGPDETTDNDVLDLRGADVASISAVLDANDAGASAGTVTFDDGSTLRFTQIETILTEAPEDGVVDGEDTGEDMGVGYDDSNAPNDGGGDVITDGADDIDGNGGDDTIDAGDGDDTVDGGDDDDLIDGGAGNDEITGSDGSDTLTGGDGDDTLDGGSGDDDIVVGAGDTGLGGGGDDEFYVDPTLDGTSPITVTGGEALEEDAIDPTNNPGGRIGDVLDLTGLGPVDVTYDETDPTFDPVTGVGESGTAIYTNDDGLPVVIAFSEIEDVLTDGPADVSPVANPDETTTDEDVPVTIDVLANDTDPDTPVEDLEVTEATAPNGSVEINDDGTLAYTADPDFFGDDTITYTVTDPEGNTATGTVDVTVDPVNDAPVANPDTAATYEATPVTIDVLGNDTDVDNTPEDLEVTEASAPNGIVDINDDGTLSYEPDAGFVGEDTITYTVTDPDGATATSTVTVSVADVSEPPVANPDAAETLEATPVTIDVLANDTDADTPAEDLQVTEADAPNGIVDINDDGTLSYEPDAGFVGEDTITYTVTDPEGNTATSTVTVSVAEDLGGDAPDAVDDSYDVDLEGYTGGNILLGRGDTGLLGNDTDPNSDPLRVVEVEDTPSLRAWYEGDNGGEFRVSSSGAVRFRDNDGDFADLADGEVAQTSVTYTISDGNGGADTATVTLNVTGAADVGTAAPDAVDDDATTTEGTLVTIDVLANDTDADTPAEDLQAIDAEAPNGIVDINDDGTLSYEPDAGFVGEDTITYTITDPEGNTDTAEVTVTVTEDIDGTPVANPDTAEVDEDDTVTIDVLANDEDPDGDPADLEVVDATAPNGTVTINDDGTLAYDPAPDFFGEDTITYTVEDLDGNQATGTATVTVAPVNDAPVAVDDTATTDEATPVTIDVLDNDTDVDNTPEELDVTEAEALNGIVDINDDGTLSYEPDTGFTGEDSITYTVSDPDGLTDTAEVAVTVNETIDGTPVANPDTAEVDEDDTVTIDVLANDEDPDGDPADLEVVDATAPNGTVTINDDGTLDYTPDADFFGEDTITYTVEDLDGNQATGTATVTVAPVNDAPVAVDDTATTDEATPVTIDVLDNDTDVDNTPEELDVTEASAANGSVTVNGDGTLSYEPDTGFTGEDTITYTVSDPVGLTDTAEVAVTVNETIDGTPVANPDTAEVDEDDTVTIDVLANDEDPDGDPADLEVVDAAAPNGTVTINDDGTLDYTPDADFFGEDIVSYTVEDPDGNQATGTATVTVAPVNDAPVAVDDTATTDEATPVTIDVLDNDTDVDNTPEELDVTEASAANGSVTVNDDGTLAYTPDTGFTGEDTITYTVSDPDGLTDTAEVAVTVNEDIGGGDGIVDGLDDGEVMNPGYTDADGDQIDGTDGIDDVINGNGGNDTIDAGEGADSVDGGAGNDVIRGGDGDDTIMGSTGRDDIFGGAGSDTYVGDDQGNETIYVDNEGNGYVTQYTDAGREGGSVNSIEHFSAAEIAGESDKIGLTTAVSESDIEGDIQGLSDEASGFFFGEDGSFLNFGPDSNYLLSNILNGTSPDGELPAVGPVGEYLINDGDEDGQIGDISFENFETIFFGVEADDAYAAMMRSEEAEAQMAEEDPVVEDDEDEIALF